MQKNEFEKQMQQKMDELQIQPSESVWQNVQLQITKKKRRRWGVLLLLFGFIIISSAGYWILRSDNRTIQDNQYNKTDKKNSHQALTTDKPLAKTENKNHDETNKAPDQRVAIKSNQNVSEKIMAIPAKAIRIHNSSPENTSIELNEPKNLNTDTETEIEVNSYTDELKPELKKIDNMNELPGSTNVQENLLPPFLTTEIELKADTLVTNPPAKNTIAFKKVNNWKLGLSFSAGISGIANNFLGFNGDKSLSADTYSNNLPANGSGNIISPSRLQRSGAFTAGFIAEKNISKKKMISIGLNYKMFSTTNKVGERNDSSLRYSLENAVNSHHNYYHFLELPVSLKIQISAKKIPLFWDAGISISQLIGSNALQYNNGTTFYYQDNSLFNKSQIGFNTGVSASFFSMRNASLLFGPYVYYSITKFANEGLYKNQHFTFIGLKSQILFKK